ncbi:MAG: zinc-binding dehydrogenase [Clostridia bacterium]|nr:zinc-binding dehydrogenase [Clostridia bacterium]
MKGFGMVKVGEVAWLEHEKPVAGPLDAILRPLYVAPCSSDTHMSHGGSGPAEDVILGHEAIGEVVEVGSLVTKFKPGDVVVVPCTTPDWTQEGIQTKHGNNAHDVGMIASFKFLTAKDGVFAEFFHVNNADSNLVLLPEGVDPEAALMCTDMMSTGFYGAEMANISLGDTVVVFGIGPVGLMAVAGARMYGAGKLIAIGTRPNCVKLAREYGATDIISYKDGDVVEQILKVAGGQVDACIVAGGKADSINKALAVTKPNGSIGNVNYFDSSETFTIPAPQVMLGMGDITIRGGFAPGGAVRMKKLLNLIQAGRVHPEKMLNYKFEGFDKIPDAFKVMDEKPADLIKPVVKITW